MDVMSGANKTIDKQLLLLETILKQNKVLMKLLERLERTELTQYYVGAGAINQTVFNYYHGYPVDYGIKDYDIVYYDSDLSYEAEDQVIQLIQCLTDDLDLVVDVKNEARVHLWYQQKFGIDLLPYQSVEEAICRWGATVTCIGVRLEKGQFRVFAPYGLNDLFQLIIRPVKEDFQEEHYQQRALKWKKKWPKLTIFPWNTK